MNQNSHSLMKAAVMSAAHQINFSEVKKPTPKAQEVLIQVTASTICGSDLHYYHEGGIGTAKVNKSFIPGHEFAGLTVNGTGEAHGLADGTLVAVDPNQPCNNCEWCHSGNHHFCPKHIFVGAPPTPGAMAEFITVPASTLRPVPTTFSAQQAALLEPLGIAIHALDLAKLRPASDIVILGAGTIGLYTLMLAQISGAVRTCVIDPINYRRNKALELGADAAFADVASYREHTQNRGADVVLEATTSPQGPDHATQAARIGGKVILIGIPDGDSFSLTASLVRRKGLTLKMSRRMGHIYPRAIQLVESDKIDVNAIVTHVMPLKDVKQAFELMSNYEDNVIKIVLEP